MAKFNIALATTEELEHQARAVWELARTIEKTGPRHPSVAMTAAGANCRRHVEAIHAELRVRSVGNAYEAEEYTGRDCPHFDMG